MSRGRLAPQSCLPSPSRPVLRQGSIPAVIAGDQHARPTPSCPTTSLPGLILTEVHSEGGGRRLLPTSQARAPGSLGEMLRRNSAHLLREEGLERWWEWTALQGPALSRGLGGLSKIDLLLRAITGSPPLSPPDIPAFRAHILCAGHEHTHHPI